MGAPLLRGPRLSLLLLLLQPHQHHCRRRFLLRLPVQGFLPLLPLPPSSCRLNHRPPPASHRPFPSVSLQYLRIPNPRVRGYWVSPLPRRSVCIHDKPIRIRWLTSVQLPDAIHQMLILSTTQESPPQYAVRRAGASGRGTSLYNCPYPDLCSTAPYVRDFPSCGSHVRKVHLGVCLACPYCPEQQYYNGSGWRKHMRAEHPSVPWYTAQVQTPPVAPPTL